MRLHCLYKPVERHITTTTSSTAAIAVVTLSSTHNTKNMIHKFVEEVAFIGEKNTQTNTKSNAAKIGSENNVICDRKYVSKTTSTSAES